MSFVFYDTETTGTSTTFDQILQFAAIRTDSDLNEIERFEIRSRLLPHIVPSPGAMRVTGVSVAQLVDLSLPSHYQMVRTVRDKFLTWSPAVFVGYNSLNFDEHLFRQALYKTLHPPYLTNSAGNSRSDALRMVQAASLFAPDAITIPAGNKNEAVFRLDRVAPANGFQHDDAHDALADVEATIHLCRLLADRAPEVWSSFMRFSQKAAVADYISTERVFCLADFYFGRPYSWLVTIIGKNADNDSEFYAYDLAVDPADLRALSEAQLITRLGRSPKPVRRIKSNASPILVPTDDAPAIAMARALAASELDRRIALLEVDSAFRDRLVAAFQATRDEREASSHVEEQLYEGFFSPADVLLCEAFHRIPWADRLPIVEQFEDQRLRIIGFQLIHCEQPAHLGQAICQEHDLARARRVLGLDGETAWLCLPKAIAEADDLLLAADAGSVTLLQEHRAYLVECQKRATDALR